MPWESIARPSLAIGTLARAARNSGFRCDALHLNLDLAADLGSETFAAFAETLELFPLGEHLFACDIFGTTELESESFLEKFGARAVVHGSQPDPLHDLRDQQIPAFLERAASKVVEAAPDVVGFSCTFNQVLPSVALSRRIKILLPDVTVIFGGACVHGPMGAAYCEAFPEWIDFVFTGESDLTFVEWLRAYSDGDKDRPIPGVVGGRERIPAQLPERLDDIAIPDFDDFFTQISELQLRGYELPSVRHLPYESSRGCWWGERSHCTFCGLNNEGMHYRRKSVERVLRELDQQSARYGITSFMASDNILDFRAYATLLEELANRDFDYDLFYEIKSNLRRADVAKLRRAGVWRVQPGIESLADHVLILMRKGVSALRNVQLLKWLVEFGVAVDYNILIGFPGETVDDYDQQLRIISVIQHLPPPHGRTTAVRVDRFSPFYTSPGELGIVGLRAAEYYRYLIPERVIAPEKYAYFFDHDQTGLELLADRVAALDSAIATWKISDEFRRARLGPRFVEIQTFAAGRLHREVLRDVEAAVFILSDAQVSVGALARRLAPMAISTSDVQLAVDRLVSAGILVGAGGNVVNVVPFADPHDESKLAEWLCTLGLTTSTPRRLAVTAAG